MHLVVLQAPALTDWLTSRVARLGAFEGLERVRDGGDEGHAYSGLSHLFELWRRRQFCLQWRACSIPRDVQRKNSIAIGERYHFLPASSIRATDWMARRLHEAPPRPGRAKKSRSIVVAMPR